MLNRRVLEAASDSHPPCFGGKAFVQSPWASQIETAKQAAVLDAKKSEPRNLLLWKCHTKRWKWSCQRTRAKRAFLVMNGWFCVFNSWLWSKLCLYLLYLCQCPAVLLVWPLLDCWMRLFLSITGSGVDAFQSSTYLRRGRNIKRSIEAPEGLSMSQWSLVFTEEPHLTSWNPGVTTLQKFLHPSQ